MNLLVMIIGGLYFGAAIYSAWYQHYAMSIVWFSYAVSAFALAYIEGRLGGY